MSFQPDEPTLCKWCDQPYRKERKRIYHESCQKKAYVHRQNVLRRIKALGRRCGAQTTAAAEALVLAGCQACGKPSVSMRGEARTNPYPIYRVWRGWLLCPACHHQLWTPLAQTTPFMQAFMNRVHKTPTIDPPRP